MTSSYISGHHASVVKSHTWRTAENSAPNLIPHLSSNPSFTLLDVGCGPGTITLDFARLLHAGHVYGIDPSPDVVSQAQARAAERGVTNVTFIAGDIFDLASVFPSGIPTFDVVHAHQVLMHVAHPVEAVRTMKSVLKSSHGILAIREADFSAMAWWPLISGLDEWRSAWQKVARAEGHNPDSGRQLLSYALEAGFTHDQITSTAAAWCYNTPEEREWWGGLWAERVLKSTFATKVVDGGFGTQQNLERFAAAWTEWSKAEDGWFAMLHGDTLCTT